MRKALFFGISFSLTLYLLTASSMFAKESESDLKSGSSAIANEPLANYSTLWGWGSNRYGELGDGTNFFHRWRPIQISTDKWNMVACGYKFSLGIKSDSTLWGWGWSHYGQFGNGNFDSSSVPVRIGTERGWKFVSAGYSSTFAIKSDGSMWACGYNDHANLGDSTIQQRIWLKQIGKDIIGPVNYVNSAYNVSAAITNDGSLWTWGFNYFGSIGDGTIINKYYPIKIGNTGEWLTVSCGYIHTVAIKTDGTLWAWGQNSSGNLGDGTYVSKLIPTQIGNDSDWVDISSECGANLALKKDGTLWAWGSNYNGELGDGTKIKKNIPTQIGKDNDWLIARSRLNYSEAVKKDGSLWYWGKIWDPDSLKDRTFLIPTKMSNITKVIQLSRGGGAGYGSQSMFIRNYLAVPGNVETLPITNIKCNTAQSGGNVTSAGSEIIYQRGICFDIRSDPTVSKDTTMNGKNMGQFQSTLTKLRPFTKYYVRAYITTAAGESYGLVERMFTKLITPILLTPQNNEIDAPIKKYFVWKKVQDAEVYRFQLSKYPDFITNDIDFELTDTCYNDVILGLNVNYFWRVQAIHEPYLSDWSVVFSFNTIKFYNQVLYSPVDNSFNLPINCQFNWGPNIVASLYLLQISKNQNFSNPDIDTIISEAEYQSTKLAFFQTYYWRVKCFFGSDSSNWSPVWRFTTQMDSVELISPVDLSKNLELSQTFIWDKGIYEKNYRLQISKGFDFNDIRVDTVIIGNSTADVKYLKHFTNYVWRVRNEYGDTLGYWSKFWNLRTKITNVQLTYPENTQTGLEQNINFMWTFVIGVDYYQLQISKNKQFTNIVYSKDSITTTEYYVPDLEPNILYYWRVRAWSKETYGTAYWSEVWTFKTSSLGVNDESEFIQIIPNPAGDFITVTLKPSEGFEPSEGSAILIYNTLGELVMFVGTGRDLSARTNIANLQKGMYFVKVGGETAKFVKL
ncbi:MAG: T9SS type A sorting domain-containing protein [bacterium]